MKIHLFATLAQAYGGDSVAAGEGLATVRDAVSYLLKAGNAGFRRELLALLGDWPACDRPEKRTALSILVNGRNIEFLDGFNTRLTPEDVITLIPPVAGG